jgi:hypothetical protein
MAIPTRKRLTPKTIVPTLHPQHDPITRRLDYGSPKELFAAMLTDTKDG